MSWYGVITNSGRDLLAEYVSASSPININYVQVGSGSVAQSQMINSTSLVYYRDTASIVEKNEINHGADFRIQIGPCASGAYKAKEIGVFASAEGSTPILFALLQNVDGVDIPALSLNPDFVYIFNILLVLDNMDNLTVTIDSAAYVPYIEFNSSIEQIDIDLNGKVDKEPGKGLSHEDYTSEEKTKLLGIEAQANKYVLPKATASVLGGVKIGTGLSVDNDGKISNSAVRSVQTGTANGTVAVNTDGTVSDVSVKGLGTAAYRDEGTFALAAHNHNASNINAGTLPVARGGTGITSNPSMLTNLATTAAAGVFQASPRPGVTGVLPIANGGTGANNAASARSNLGVAAVNHTHTQADIGFSGYPDKIGFFLGNGGFQRVNVGFDISKVIMFPFGYRNNTLTTQQNDYAESYSAPGNQRLSRNPSATNPNSVLSWLQSDQDFGLGIVPSGFACNYGGGQFCENASGVMYMYWAWK